MMISAGVRRGIVVAVAVLLALASMIWSYADWLGREHPEFALRLGLRTPLALSALADLRFADASRPDRLAEAKTDADAALAAAPLNVRAVRLLALIAEQSGDTSRAENLMRLADARSHRDPVTEFWLFESDALDGNFGDAALHADAALRRDWRLSRVLYPAMAATLANPAAVRPIAVRLEERPDWRRPFLDFLSGSSDDPNVPGRLLTALARGPAPPSDQESATVIERMVDAGDFAGARALWVRLLPPGAHAPAAGVYNGDFAPDQGAPPFNWRLLADNGAEAETGPANDGFPALYSRSPADSNRPLAGQVVMLPQGAWRLIGRVRVEPGESGPLFAWRVACASGGDLAEAQIAADPPGWRGFAADFSVPAGCPVQILRLFGLSHPGFDPAEAYWRGLAVHPLQPEANANASRKDSSAD